MDTSQSAEGSTSSTNASITPNEEIKIDQAGEELPYVLLADGHKRYPKGKDPMLRYKKPYWWPYKTFVKDRWIGRELLEVVSTEFRDRSVEYYKHALESGVTRVNGVVASPNFVLRNGDRIDNTVHRHEPPITNDPILVLHMDKEREFVVISKPGSIPVHAAGRYFRHTVLELMQSDYNIKCYSVNRLDRLTSGLMILALTGPASRDLSMEFAEGRIRKEYVARVTGKFPEGRVVVDKPLLTVDRQMGLVIVTPEGKEAKTIFKRLSYDEKRDQSVIHCRPLTGRTHQIRVHLQYLGFPIANDPLYSQPAVWGEAKGKGGVDLNPSPEALSAAETFKARQKDEQDVEEVTSRVRKVDLSDREYSNIDAGSPILLSQQAKDIIAKLRKARDEAEDWVKWKEVVFTAKAAQDKMDADSASNPPSTGTSTPAISEDASTASTPTKRPKAHPKVGKYSRKDDVPEPLDNFQSTLRKPAHLPPGFCEECFVPVPEDPDPEKLFIFLHALRYTTPRLGAWATPLPRWAGKEWDGDWRGWSDDPVPSPFPDEHEEEAGEKAEQEGVTGPGEVSKSEA